MHKYFEFNPLNCLFNTLNTTQKFLHLSKCFHNSSTPTFNQLFKATYYSEKILPNDECNEIVHLDILLIGNIYHGINTCRNPSCD